MAVCTIQPNGLDGMAEHRSSTNPRTAIRLRLVLSRGEMNTHFVRIE